jgi:hypothetical protein
MMADFPRWGWLTLAVAELVLVLVNLYRIAVGVALPVHWVELVLGTAGGVACFHIWREERRRAS